TLCAFLPKTAYANRPGCAPGLQCRSRSRSCHRRRVNHRPPPYTSMRQAKCDGPAPAHDDLSRLLTIASLDKARDSRLIVLLHCSQHPEVTLCAMVRSGSDSSSSVGPLRTLSILLKHE